MMVDDEGSSASATMFGVLEIYKNKSGISTLIADTAHFKVFHDTVKEEGLYDKPGEIVAWHPRVGFVSRDTTAPPFGKGTVVVMAKVLLKNGMTEKFLEGYMPFLGWLKDNEPDTLSYAIFTRPKAPHEVLVFERYNSASVFEAHRRTKVFRAMSKNVQPYIGKVVLNEWEEQDGSFVGNVVGGGQESLSVGDTSKL